MNIATMLPCVLFAAVIVLGLSGARALAQTSSRVVFVPLIGITSVPDPLALPQAGNVTYHYAVKNFLKELRLADIRITDSNCSPATFSEGDDNQNRQLDWSETWRYICTTRVSTTTASVAMVTGTVNGMTATHSAYATVVVGSNIPAPLVSIVNITKVASPFPLPEGGGHITFTYRVNNPGVVPLGAVTVTDDKCSTMSNKLGDTNGNSLLDPTEVWIYSCTTTLTRTTTNTATVTAFANGLKASDNFSLTVTLAPSPTSSPHVPDTGSYPGDDILWWDSMAGGLVVLLVIFASVGKRPTKP